MGLRKLKLDATYGTQTNVSPVRQVPSVGGKLGSWVSVKRSSSSREPGGEGVGEELLAVA